MYRVMTVDDEIWVLRGLKKYICWEDYGFSIDTAFTDSQKACEAFERDPVDVVFADIRMAGIDGLEMIERMRRIRPETQFVILSAYSQFDYAKRAIALGVADYLVKPVTREALHQMLTALRQRLDMERTQKEKQRLYETLTSPNFVLTQEAFSLLTGLAHRPGMRYAAFAWRNTGVQILLTQNACVRFESSDGQFAFALCQACEERLEQLFLTIDKSARETDCVVGASECFEIFTQVHDALDCALTGADQGFFGMTGGLVRVPLHAVQPPQMEGVLRLMREGEFHTAAHALEGIRSEDCAREWNAQLAFYFYRETTRIVIDAARNEGTGAQARLLASSQAMVRSFGSFDRLKTQMCAMLLGAGQGSGALEIMRVEAYIARHYTQDINVQGIAQVFSVDPDHLGKMYRKKMGKSIRESLTDKRIAHACRLLEANDGASVQQIALMSGFSDPFYFNKVFKKAKGMAPSQYRSSQRDKR